MSFIEGIMSFEKPSKMAGYRPYLVTIQFVEIEIQEKNPYITTFFELQETVYNFDIFKVVNISVV